VPESTLRSTQGTHPVARVRAHPAIPPGPVALIHRASPDNPRLALLREALGLR